MRKILVFTALILVLSMTYSYAIEATKHQISDPYFLQTVEECYLQYYYYIPCPTSSWFWGFYEWEAGDIIGQFFVIGDDPTGVYSACDPGECHTLDKFRVLDFWGHGATYPGNWTVEFDIWCADADGCPVGPSLWNSGPFETEPEWGFVDVDPPLFLTTCCIYTEPDTTHPRILITATHVGSDPTYPRWGTDDISTPLLTEPTPCEMHDIGCWTALYPRPTSSHYATIHSGYYGTAFEYCPPLWFADGEDETPDASLYGYVEFAWRLYLLCEGPDAVEPTTWGTIKSMYE